MKVIVVSNDLIVDINLHVVQYVALEFGLWQRYVETY